MNRCVICDRFDLKGCAVIFRVTCIMRNEDVYSLFHAFLYLLEGMPPGGYMQSEIRRGDILPLLAHIKRWIIERHTKG